ncbi:MAG: hypothetical protein Q4B86_06890 [Eubacteriales bacterium]|nr:hypothetical protein [Eubacteriales bacterium]
MGLEKAYLRAVVENREQFNACLKADKVELIYIDSEMVQACEYKDLVRLCHNKSKRTGLRMPHIWRTEAEKYFTRFREEIKAAGFDAFLFRNFEGEVFFEINDLIGEAEVVLDNTVYAFNHSSEEFISELLGNKKYILTLSEELNKNELTRLSSKLKSETELKVYGHASMMVSAQCIRKTVLKCDKCPSTMYLKDRKGAMLPVKNHCLWCYNNILNSVPTVIYDLEKDIDKISPDYIRYDFTIESESEVSMILDNAGYMPKDFTRGHFKRGVE